MNAVYAPGTVAVATVRGVPNVLVMRRRIIGGAGDDWAFATNEAGVKYTCSSDPAEVTDVHPLIVIDPEDRAQVERLVVAHCRAYCCDPTPLQPEEVAIMQDALREFANPKPPKPVEPLGLGAVVEDTEGVQWVKIKAGRGTNWRQANAITPGRFLLYADIDVVRVLSEGIQ